MRLFEIFMSGAGELSASGLLLRLALAICSVFAMVHLLSLWGTRYGDNHTMSKSFFLSLVFHGCFCLGWATVAETYPRRPQSTETENIVQTPITFMESEDSAPNPGTNKLPVWQSGAAAPGPLLARNLPELNRRERDSDVPEIESPEIDKNPETKVEQDVPEFAAQMDERTPDLEESSPAPSNSPPSVAANPMDVDVPEAEARPEVSASAPIARASVSRPIVSMEATPRPQFTRGSSLRAGPSIEDGMTMTLPSEIEIDSPPQPMGKPGRDTIRRAESPNPTPLIDNVAGSGTDGNSNVAGTSNPRRADRMTRNTSRNTDAQDDLASRPAVPRNQPASVRTPEERMLVSRPSNEPLDDLPQPNFVKPKAPTMSRAPARAPETYQARTSTQRMSSVLKNGGSDDSERAVEASLKWLANVQEFDGRWSSSRHGGGLMEKDPQGEDRLGGGKQADTGITGLVILSFLGAGYTHESGPYTTEVRKAIDWLIAQQQHNGYLGGNATKYDQNYCHAMATFALAEAYAMQKEANEFPELRNAVKRGVKLICVMQNEDGGWRYGKTNDSDMSMFGWQLMALKSAVNAGIPVPEETRRGMVKFLEDRGLGKHGGLAGYKKNSEPTAAMTAEALFCRQMFAVNHNDAASQEAVAYLRRNLPRITAYDEYYWYYGTLAMHHLDNDAWQEWNHSLRDMLVSIQRKDGPQAGSWDPKGKWAGIGGRLYSTALSTMCLEVYYRYQSTAKPGDGH